jgi:hypothetical protein
MSGARCGLVNCLYQSFVVLNAVIDDFLPKLQCKHSDIFAVGFIKLFQMSGFVMELTVFAIDEITLEVSRCEQICASEKMEL